MVGSRSPEHGQRLLLRSAVHAASDAEAQGVSRRLRAAARGRQRGEPGGRRRPDAGARHAAGARRTALGARRGGTHAVRRLSGQLGRPGRAAGDGGDGGGGPGRRRVTRRQRWWRWVPGCAGSSAAGAAEAPGRLVGGSERPGGEDHGRACAVHGGRHRRRRGLESAGAPLADRWGVALRSPRPRKQNNQFDNVSILLILTVLDTLVVALLVWVANDVTR